MAKKEIGDLRKYELMVILKATLPDAQKKAALKKIEDMLGEFGGSVEEQEIWGKRFMAFPIKKHNEGYYVVENIVMPAGQTKEFVRLMGINGDVLRSLLRSVSTFEKITVPAESPKTRPER